MALTRQQVQEFSVYAKCCSLDIANSLIDSQTYGKPDCEEIRDKLLMLHSLIKFIDRYYVPDSNDFVLNGVQSLNGNICTLSENNSLYLPSQGNQIQLTPDDVNCISEEDLCEYVTRILAFCESCLSTC